MAFDTALFVCIDLGCADDIHRWESVLILGTGICRNDKIAAFQIFRMLISPSFNRAHPLLLPFTYRVQRLSSSSSKEYVI
jgi:hypothetical protein